jgi:hypothetical protein
VTFQPTRWLYTAKAKKMKEIIIQIDGKEVRAAEGMTVLQAAKSER